MTSQVIGQYVSKGESIHITKFPDNKTLCGRALTADWIGGDETVSGIAATCKTCKKILKGVNT